MENKIVQLSTENIRIIDDIKYLTSQNDSQVFFISQCDKTIHNAAIKNAKQRILINVRLICIKEIRLKKNIELMHNIAKGNNHGK